MDYRAGPLTTSYESPFIRRTVGQLASVDKKITATRPRIHRSLWSREDWIWIEASSSIWSRLSYLHVSGHAHLNSKQNNARRPLNPPARLYSQSTLHTPTRFSYSCCCFFYVFFFGFWIWWCENDCGLSPVGWIERSLNLLFSFEFWTLICCEICGRVVDRMHKRL